jgi:hypothetical protein
MVYNAFEAYKIAEKIRQGQKEVANRKRLEKIRRSLKEGETYQEGSITVTGKSQTIKDKTYSNKGTTTTTTSYFEPFGTQTPQPEASKYEYQPQQIQKNKTAVLQQGNKQIQQYQTKEALVYRAANKINPITDSVRTRNEPESIYRTKEFVYGAVGVGVQFGKDLIDPIGSVKRNVAGVKTFISKPVESFTFLASKTTNPRDAGEIAGIIGLTKTTSFGLKKISSVSPKIAKVTNAYLNPEVTLIDKTTTKVKDTVLKIGAKYIPPEEVFSSDVLVKGQTFPTSRSVEESLTRFKAAKSKDYLSVDIKSDKLAVLDIKTNLVGSSATSTAFAKKTVVSAGEKATVENLEDAGLYITPKGEGSPYFTRAGNEDISYGSGIFPSFEFAKKPSVINVEYNKVSKYPRNILDSKGFTKVNDFLNIQGTKAKGTAYITKRFTLGQTSEIEAVIPQNTPLVRTLDGGNIINKITGFKEYTKYKGRTVTLFDYKVDKSLTNLKTKTTLSTELSSGKGYYSYSKEIITTPKYNVLSSSYKTPELSYSSVKSSNKNDIIESSKKSSKKEDYYSASYSLSYKTSKYDSYKPKSYNPSYKPSSYKGRSSGGSSYKATSYGGGSFGGSSYKPPKSTSYRPKLPVPPTTIYPKLPNFPKSSQSKKFDIFGAFKVEVKRKGKFRTLATGLTKGEALRFGQRYTDITTSRSFKITPFGTTRRQKNGFVDLLRYRQSKKTPNVFIEKTKFAISTGGEKGELKRAKYNIWK